MEEKEHFESFLELLYYPKYPHFCAKNKKDEKNVLFRNTIIRGISYRM
jgi:hypothetical protein